MTYEKSIAKGRVSVTIWNNEPKDEDGFAYKTFTAQKSYKVGDEWKQTSTFSENELKDLRTVIDAVLNEFVTVRGKTEEKKEA